MRTAKASTNDKRGTSNLYLLPEYYTLHWFSERNIYTDQARQEFARREAEERVILERKARPDMILWKRFNSF